MNDNSDSTPATSFPAGPFAVLDGTSVLFYTKNLAAVRPTTITATWVGLDDVPAGYNDDDTVPFSWNELSSSPTAVRLPMDTLRPYADAQVEMPFSIDFYSYPTDGKLCVSKNGTMRFASGAGCATDNTLSGNPVLLMAPAEPLWAFSSNPGPEQMTPYVGGDVYYETQGNAPNRRAIVEWSHMGFPAANFGDPGQPITFEVIIEEVSGTITFQYLTMDTGRSTTANGATVVAQIFRDSPGYATAPNPILVYSDNQSNLTAGKAIRFTPTANPFVARATATAQIQIATPVATTTPGSMAPTAAVGTSAIATLTIGNQGNSPLTWNLGEVDGLSGVHIATLASLGMQTSRASTASKRWNDDMSNDPRLAIGPAESGTTPTQPFSPLATTIGFVPAYGFSLNGSSFVSLDVSAPASVHVIGNTFPGVQVGAFINNDFSREYAASNSCDSSCYDANFGYLFTTDGTERFLGYGPTISPFVPGTSDIESWAGIKADPATPLTLYGVATNGGAGDTSFASCGTAPLCRTDLFTIDPTTGLGTWLVQIDSIDPSYGTLIADIAIASNGDMYGLNMLDDTFYLIDKTTGHVRPIGASGLSVGFWPWQSMDFDQTSGILYYATWPGGGAPSAMYTVDLVSGSATQIGLVSGGTDALRGLAIAKPGGPCANPTNVQWLSFDMSSGSIDPQGSTNVTVMFNASGLASGVYNAKICVNSNTQFDSTIAVPVTFTVGSGDVIFKNGFDAN